MMPGTIPFNAPQLLPQTLQFGRHDYNGGVAVSATTSININNLFPFIVSNDDIRLDALWWQGSWCDGWRDRVAFYFKYGTSYSQTISGGGSKNHYIYLTYSGGTTATIGHNYSGDDTSYKFAEVSIDRLYYLGTTGQANSYQKNLAA